MNLSKSYCRNRGTRLHKFVSIASTNEGVAERCVKCGQKHVIKLVNGNPHITDYGRYHVREFLVPQHRLFLREFPQHG